MKIMTAGVLATALLSAAPALAIEIGVGPDGIRVGPRYRDYDRRYYYRDDERYFRDRRYRNRADCRRVTIDRPDGSRVVRYRCD